jgi:hypothetical protein
LQRRKSRFALLSPSSNVFFGRWSAVSGCPFCGASGEEEADGHQQDLTDEAEEEPAGHSAEHAGQQAQGGVEAEDAEETLEEATQPIRCVELGKLHRENERMNETNLLRTERVDG